VSCAAGPARGLVGVREALAPYVSRAFNRSGNPGTIPGGTCGRTRLLVPVEDLVHGRASGRADQTIDGRVRRRQSQSLEKLTDAVYQQLREIAECHLRSRFGTSGGLTWQPTTLVNETLMRVIKQRQACDSEGHFFAIATTIMKRVLLDYVRERRAQKRGGDWTRVEFDPELHCPVDPGDAGDLDIDALFAAIDRLESLDKRKADIARMRVIWGMPIAEIVTSLDVSLATVERDWSFASAWLRRELAGEGPRG